MRKDYEQEIRELKEMIRRQEIAHDRSDSYKRTKKSHRNHRKNEKYPSQDKSNDSDMDKSDSGCDERRNSKDKNRHRVVN